MWIDNKLSLNSHVTSVLKKLANFSGILYSARSCFSKGNLLRFYYSYVKPIIHYGILAYDATSKVLMEKILKMQKRLLRSNLLSKQNMDSVKHLFDKETVYEIYFQQLCKESIEQYTGVSEIALKLYKPTLDQGIKTKSKTKGVFRVPKFCSIATGKSLSVEPFKFPKHAESVIWRC